MAATLFAILSALGFGSSQFFIQMGLKEGRATALQGLLLNLLAANAVLVVALVFSWSSGPVPMNAPGMIYFAAAGFAAPFAGRTAIFLSVRNIGGTRSASLAMSESLFAAALAYAILGQRVSAVTVAGIVILVAATVLFINETSRTFPSLAPSESPAGTETVPAGGDWAPGGTKAGVFFGFSAGFFFAVAGIFRQLGVDAIPSALLGSVVGTSVALVVVIIQTLQHGSLRAGVDVGGRDTLYFAVSGVLASIGMLAFFLALQLHGTVAISTALKSMAPVVTFALSAAFLARWERLSGRTALLVLGVVAGAVLTALGRF